MLQYARNERSVVRFLCYRLLSYLAGCRHICHSQGHSAFALPKWFQSIPENHSLFAGHYSSMVPDQFDRNYNASVRGTFFGAWLGCRIATACRCMLGGRVFQQSGIYACFCAFLALGSSFLAAKINSGKRSVPHSHRLNFRARLGIGADFIASCSSLVSRLVYCYFRNARPQQGRYSRCRRAQRTNFLSSFPSRKFSPEAG